MRIGLIGVGRIGAFHARNLTALPVVEELVISDAVPRSPTPSDMRSAPPRWPSPPTCWRPAWTVW